MEDGGGQAHDRPMETVDGSTPPSDAPPYKEPGNRLTRSTGDKVVSGLAGGLGRYFGIDPLVFRIAFVVLTLAGGSGVLLYLLGWVMIPDDARGTALRRLGHERNQKLVAAVLAGVGVLVLLDDLRGSRNDVPVGLVLVAVGALLLWSRGNGPPPPPPPPPPPTGDAEPDIGRPSVTGSPVPAPPEPPPDGEAKPRSALVAVTLSLLAVLAGGLSLLRVSVTTGLALALLLTGGALIVGAWRGRARWLIPVGLLLAAALATASLVDVPVRGGAGDVAYRPASLSEVRSPYRLAAGDLVVDLGDVELAGRTVDVVASVAAGNVRIVVPPGVAVDVDAHVGAGNLDVLGRRADGLDLDRAVSEPGPEGAGRLVITAGAGFGRVEVRRALP